MNFKINIAIVDDDINDIKEAEKNIMNVNALPGLIDVDFIIDGFANSESFIENLKKYDIVFLDVEMPGMNGFEVAREVNVKNPSCLIIFLTGRYDSASYGYRFRAFRYLVKPVGKKEFEETILDAVNEIRSLGWIKYYDGSKEKILWVENILYLLAYGKETIIFTTDGLEINYKSTLKNVENIIPSWLFFRCNRHLSINLNHYDGVDPSLNDIFLKNGNEIIKLEISHRQKKRIDKKLHEYRRMRGRI